MEESKELQGFYRIFRTVVYVSVLLEFFEYAIDPAVLDHWGGILTDIHRRIKQWVIYRDGGAHLHHLCRYTEQETPGVQRTQTGSISVDRRTAGAGTLRLVVRT